MTYFLSCLKLFMAYLMYPMHKKLSYVILSDSAVTLSDKMLYLGLTLQFDLHLAVDLTSRIIKFMSQGVPYL